MFLRKLLTRLGVSARLADNTTMSSGVITYDELKKLLCSGPVQLYDVRNPDEVKNGKLPNSVNIPVTEIEDALKLDAAAFKNKYNVDKPKPDDENLIFHCQMGRRGQKATEIAVGLGYKNARNFDGGYKLWEEKERK